MNSDVIILLIIILCLGSENALPAYEQYHEKDVADG